MKADGLRDAVDEDGVREGCWDDVCEADAEKVCRANHRLVVDVAYFHEDEEYRRKEVSEAGEDSEACRSGFLVVGERIIFGSVRR